MYLTETLKWDVQICEKIKKAQKRMHVLSKTTKVFPCESKHSLMINFYSAVIESCITCSIIIWFVAAPKKETV